MFSPKDRVWGNPFQMAYIIYGSKTWKSWGLPSLQVFTFTHHQAKNHRGIVGTSHSWLPVLAGGLRSQFIYDYTYRTCPLPLQKSASWARSFAVRTRSSSGRIRVPLQPGWQSSQRNQRGGVNQQTRGRSQASQRGHLVEAVDQRLSLFFFQKVDGGSGLEIHWSPKSSLKKNGRKMSCHEPTQPNPTKEQAFFWADLLKGRFWGKQKPCSCHFTIVSTSYTLEK